MNVVRTAGRAVDTREASDIAPTSTGGDDLSDELRPMVRSFFVKLSYAWRP